mgnify:CR=1 FL=1
MAGGINSDEKGPPRREYLQGGPEREMRMSYSATVIRFWLSHKPWMLQ